MHCTSLALSLALASAGKSKPARIAIIAMTTSNSMRVKPLTLRIDVLRIQPGQFEILGHSDRLSMFTASKLPVHLNPKQIKLPLRLYDSFVTIKVTEGKPVLSDPWKSV